MAKTQDTSTLSRVSFTIVNLIGRTVRLKKQNGLVLEGIFATGSMQRQWDALCLKFAKVVSVPDNVDCPSFAPTDTVVIQMSQVEYIHALDALGEEKISVDKVAGGFRTDTDISKSNTGKGPRRSLETVSGSWLTGGVSGDLGSAGDMSGFDQFQVNADKFGVRSTYDENLYTVKLERDALTPDQIRHAERLAREIERQETSNPHMMEERGHKMESDAWDDEEARYGAVVGSGAYKSSGAAGSYKPPHLRNTKNPDATGKSAPEPASTTAAPPTMSFAAALKGSSSQEKPTAKPDVASGKVAESVAQDKKPNPNATKSSTTKDAAPVAVSSERAKLTEELKNFSKGLQPKTSGDKDAAGPDAAKKKATDGSTPAASSSKKKLNPNAKEFTFNAAAKPFQPRASPAPAPAMAPGVPVGGPAPRGFAPPQGMMAGGMYPPMVDQFGYPMGGYMPVPGPQGPMMIFAPNGQPIPAPGMPPMGAPMGMRGGQFPRGPPPPMQGGGANHPNPPPQQKPQGGGDNNK